MSESTPLVSEQSYTDKQRKLIESLSSVILQEGIRLEINPLGKGISGIWAIDVEHDESGGLVGIGIAQEKRCYYWTILERFIQSSDSAILHVAHNGVSDIECLRSWGINVIDSQLIWDTMLIGHLLDSSLKDYGLKAMAKRELAIEYTSYDAIVGKRGLKAERITLDKQPLELVSRYNAMDCYVTYRLYEKQMKALGGHGYL